jgi:hypothetical protein
VAWAAHYSIPRTLHCEPLAAAKRSSTRAKENETALAVYEAAGYRRDGSVRESEFRSVDVREPPLVKLL